MLEETLSKAIFNSPQVEKGIRDIARGAGEAVKTGASKVAGAAKDEAKKWRVEGDSTYDYNQPMNKKPLNKGIFGRKKPDLSDPKLRESVHAAGAEIDAQTQAQSAKRQKASDLLSSYSSSPSKPPAMSQGMQSAMADIQARKKANEANQPGIEASLEKGVGDLLGISQRSKDTKALKNFRAGFKDGGEFHQGNTKLNMVTEHATGGASQGIDHSKVRSTAMATYNNHRQPQVGEDGSVTPPKSVKQAIDATTNTMGHAMQGAHSRLIDDHAGEGAGAAAHNKFFPGSVPKRPSASINKSTPMLGMFQEFMAKEKKSTDTPLGNQTTHPDHKGEEERRKQLARVQEEFGLPEKTHSAEYNRYAHVDYKHPHSFTSSRVVNQSGQDLASAQIGEHPVEDTVERLQALRKQEDSDYEYDSLSENWPSKVNGHAPPEFASEGATRKPAEYSRDDPTRPSMRQARAKMNLRETYGPHEDNISSVSTMTNGRGLHKAGEKLSPGHSENVIDKVLSKLFKKAGKDKEDRGIQRM